MKTSPPSDPTVPSPTSGELIASKTDAEELTISNARSHWVAGDWRALTALETAEIEPHPQRDRIALLVACAHQQLGSAAEATRFARQALKWGCQPNLAARLLLSGLHNTFGRIAALQSDNGKARSHFEAALGLTGDRDSRTAAHGRAVREMASLGLLPQAAWLVQDEMNLVLEQGRRPALDAARVEMLRSELELLQHELALSQQRNLRLVGNAIDARSQATPKSAMDPAVLMSMSTSQLGQDLWVLERSDYRHNGFFVEFGATDGVRLSNTYLLEKQFGWTGICAEPNPHMLSLLRANRDCTVTDACVGSTSGEEVDFVLAAEYGGRVQDMYSDSHADKRRAYWSDPAFQAKFVTESLHDMLVRLGAPRQIDYLSIDTEGSEYDILAAFPFESWKLRLITVEHNFTPMRDRIRALLESKGYVCTQRSHDDFYELLPSERS